MTKSLTVKISSYITVLFYLNKKKKKKSVYISLCNYGQPCSRDEHKMLPRWHVMFV